MTVPARLALFTLLLLVVFVVAAGIGALVGPVDDAPSSPPHTSHPR